MPGCLGGWPVAACRLLSWLGWWHGPWQGDLVGSVKFSGHPTFGQTGHLAGHQAPDHAQLILGIADGCVLCDGEVVFEANDIRAGLFKDDA